MNKMVSALVNADNVTFTEKGSLAFKSTLNPVLDYFVHGRTMRLSSALDVDRLFSASFFADKLLTLKTMFYLRRYSRREGRAKSFSHGSLCIS